MFNNTWQYLTIFDYIWQRKRSHLKPESCHPKISLNILIYYLVENGGKRTLKQNIMNLRRLRIFVCFYLSLCFLIKPSMDIE